MRGERQRLAAAHEGGKRRAGGQSVGEPVPRGRHFGVGGGPRAGAALRGDHDGGAAGNGREHHRRDGSDGGGDRDPRRLVAETQEQPARALRQRGEKLRGGGPPGIARW